MTEAVWVTMLFVLYVVAALPALAIVLYLRRRTTVSEIPRRLLSAILVALFIAPGLAVLGHMPLVLPFAATFFFDNSRGLHFLGWNILVAAIAFLTGLCLPQRSNHQLQRTRASGAARPSHGPLN